eukprot:14938038-Alexandrium_andersonii.AAC.1
MRGRGTRPRADSCPFPRGPNALAEPRRARQNNAADASTPPAQDAAPPVTAKAKGEGGQGG